MNRFDIPVWEAVAHLRDASFGRLSIIDHGVPLSLPVSSKVIGADGATRIVMRTSPSSLLGRYEGPASFEIDRVDEEHHEAWSVIARGRLRHAYGDPSLPDPEPWLDHHRVLWLVLDVDAISARRFVGTSGSDGFAVEWTLAEV